MHCYRRRFGTSSISSFIAIAMVTTAAVPGRCIKSATADDVEPATTQSLLSVDDRSGGSARFIWSAGKLQLDAPRHKTGTRSLQTAESQQRLSITAAGGIPSLQYTLNTATESLRLDVTAAKQLTIVHRTQSTNGSASSGSQTTIHQPDRGPIETIVRSGDEVQKYSDATWLHLYLNHRQGVPPSVWTLVNRLPSQTIEQLVAHVDGSLRRTLRSSSHSEWGVPDRMLSEQDFRELLAKLRSPRRAQRAAAHRRLLAAGTFAAIQIEKYRGDLDAHQSQVLASVWRAVHPPMEDHAGSLASRLYADRDYWLGWQNRHAGPMPAAVALHLNQLGIGVEDSLSIDKIATTISSR